MEANNLDQQYKDLLRHVLRCGERKDDRTGTGTLSVFDYTIRHNMKDGFPILTSKKIFMKGVIHELIWFLNGDTNVKYLIDNDVHIWDGDCYKAYEQDWIKENRPAFGGPFNFDDTMMTQEMFIEKIKHVPEFAKIHGELGPIYGKQWRDWAGIDQIKNLISDLKTNPDSRRLLVNSWNVSELENMTLPPCHYSFQCYTKKLTLNERKDIWTKSIDKSIHYAKEFGHTELDERNVPTRKLSLKFIMRSNDLFLGLPFNLASYGLLLELLAKEVNMISDELIYSGGDVHLYQNHIDQATEQLSGKTFKLPTIKLSNNSIFDLKYEDIEILNYESDKAIKAKLSN